MSKQDQIMQNLSEKLDKLDERLDSVDKTLIKQEANLAEHIRRTEIAEMNISDIQDQFKPVQRHINMVEGSIKFIGLISLAVGIAVGVLQVLKIITELF
jgi:chromosome segregation ATPase